MANPAAQALETIPGLDANAAEFRAAQADGYYPVERSMRTAIFQNASWQMAVNAQVDQYARVWTTQQPMLFPDAQICVLWVQLVLG